MMIVLWIEAQAELQHRNRMQQYDNEEHIEYCLA